MPLAASKLELAILVKLLGASCNRPNAACGIETFYIRYWNWILTVATDLMPLAASKPYNTLHERPLEDCCNRPNAACGIETMLLVPLIQIIGSCNRPNAACGIET